MSSYKYEIRNFSLDNNETLLAETLFHNANGYLGVRSNFEEGYPEGYDTIRGEYINGFYDIAKMPQAEKLYGLVEEKQTMLNVADTQGIKLYIDGEEFSMFEGEVISSIRTLDMKKGITIRELIWCSPKGRKVNIQIKRMASFSILPLFFIEYSVTPLNFDGEVEFVSTHKGNVMNYFNPNDPRVAGEAFNHLQFEEKKLEDNITYMVMKTSKSNLQVCSATHNFISDVKTRSLEETDSEVKESLKVDATLNKSITLYKYTVLCDSVRYTKPLIWAGKIMKQSLKLKVEDLYVSQEQYLKEFWDNCEVEVFGDQTLNTALHYNLYQLIQSVGKDIHSNIAAKGLSGEGYEGHFFWDTEMYMQPFFTLTERNIAKNLIRYRYTILDHAKENAKILGHEKGAAYPWRTIMGKECSGYFPSGSAQYHISGDVAYSIITYYLATKDLNLMKECGVEILIETARLWLELGNYYNDQFYINEVTGPDEYTCLVNNNYYTNVLAQHNLKWAVKGFELLKEQGIEKELVSKTGITKEELLEFQEASEKMYLPYDEKLGINPQDDSFLQKKVWDVNTIPEDKKPLLLHYHPMFLYRYQICKQADTVLAHFILEDAQDLETIRRSFDYYEKITTHDSSLSTCIFSIVASKLGLIDKAYEYFGESAKLDLCNTHKNSKDGIHTANMGGTYMAIVYGFGGLRIKESGLYINPLLPKQWEGYKFRVLFEDGKIEVEVREDYCRVVLLEGKSKLINIYGKIYELENQLEIKRG